MKLGDFIPLTEAISALVEQPLPFEHSYPLGVLLKKTTPEVETYQKARQKLADECLAKDEEGKPIAIDVATGRYALKEDKREYFHQQVGELDAVEIAVEFPTLTISKAKELKLVLSGRHIAMLLGHVLVEDAPKAPAPATK